MPQRKEYTSSNARLQVFTDRFRAKVDEVGGVGEASKILKISRPTVSFWYYGERTPDAESLIKIARSFGLTTDYLLGLSDIPATNLDADNAVKFTGLDVESAYYLHDLKNESSSTASNTLKAINVLLGESGDNTEFWRRLQAYLFTPERGGFRLLLETGEFSMESENVLSGLIALNNNYLESLRNKIQGGESNGKR